MTIDDVIRWSEIHIKLIEDDLPTIKDQNVLDAQMRAYLVNKMYLKSLQCWQEFLEETINSGDFAAVERITKYITQIEEEGKEI